LGLKAEDAASAPLRRHQGRWRNRGTAVEQVRKAMTDVIAGVKVVVKEPFKSNERRADTASTTPAPGVGRFTLPGIQ